MSLAFVIKFLLVFSRLSAFTFSVPIFFPKGTSNTAKASFSILLSYMLVSLIQFDTVASFDLISLGFMVIMEVVTGLTLGFITSLGFHVIRMAGQLFDFFIGFSMSQMFDPSVGDNSSIFGRLMYWFTLIIFVILNGHKFIIEGLLTSFSTVKLGELAITTDVILYIFDVIIKFFEIGIKISMPIALIILIINIVLGLVARSVPQLNVMIIGMPIKVLIGVLSIIVLLPVTINSIVDIFENLTVIFQNLFGFIPLLIVFADSGGEKTEDATPKKKRDARKKGQVVRSKELTMALTLGAATLVIILLGSTIFKNLALIMNTVFSDLLNTQITQTNVLEILKFALFKGLLVIIMFVCPIMIIGVLANYLQVGFLLTGDPLKPDLKKLNPISGFKKILSLRSLVTLVKDLLIISIIGYVGYKFIISAYPDLIKINQLSISQIPIIMKNLLQDVFIKITIVMISISIMDYIYQRYQHNKDLKMSKQEIKEEFKQMEGDPQIKSQIKQKQREMATKRMMQAVPDASVVITNPTHIAVALKYVDGVDEAPIVLAKGKDFVAVQIKERAKENEIPIIENKPLARMIFSEVEIDEEVPENMYQAVAEILAIVYKLKK
ncbi:fused FliR family export protein/FlhB family type III secretion system protein [Oceanirhabdus sp. W0125-5]|uniref:fused FliR family export protein/FlhB family type III secretion system protein n=1 Tax=Oceanirhabdus sp. W0125-5 TaxID=2999116 RepID=UPI0022F2B971|nr:fused FliR family export protein/FlhB family type III secretion system protein [Oceanirhabdus sp. W0125-5]WBW95415.1 fused FliR family export protein/FlhB family type III secretion system protein [Oceanirhabdus sp. W0125-5]